MENNSDQEESKIPLIVPRSIYIKHKDYFHKVEFTNIIYIEASGSYCIIHLKTINKITVSFSLTEIVKYLPAELFIRVHRSYAVNKDCIDAFIGNILIVGNDRIPISRSYKKDVFSQLYILGMTKNDDI